MINMNTVLVTGSTGFIGRYVVESLLAKDYNVHCITSNLDLSQSDSPTVTYHYCDLLNPVDLDKLLKTVKADLLVHLAWQIKPGVYESIDNFRWVRATLNLVEKFYESNDGAGRSVVAGSAFEYDRNYALCDELTTPLAPDTLYGQCKRATGDLFEAYLSTTESSGAWARIFNVYGPHEPAKRLVPAVIGDLLSKRPVKCSSGNHFRDFMHVFDVAEAIVKVLENKEFVGPVNIASGRAIQIKKIVEFLAERLDSSVQIDFGSLKTNDESLPYYIANTELLNQRLDFTPQYSIEDGLNQTIDWWRNS